MRKKWEQQQERRLLGAPFSPGHLLGGEARVSQAGQPKTSLGSPKHHGEQGREYLGAAQELHTASMPHGANICELLCFPGNIQRITDSLV